jgi:hypothetical protein
LSAKQKKSCKKRKIAAPILLHKLWCWSHSEESFQSLCRCNWTWRLVITLLVQGSGVRSQGQRDFANSLGTGADHSRRRWVNQGHVHSLAAIFGADDLCHSFWPRLAQQLPCRRRQENALRDIP